MSVDHIVLQSAGSLSVAILALFMAVLQVIFLFKKPELKWFGWSAAISFSCMLYAFAVFVQYNASAGSLIRHATMLEFTTIICLIHSLYGFTYSYFGKKGNRYHAIAGFFHGVAVITVWTTHLFVPNAFVSRHFLWLSSPFTEPVKGLLVPYFDFYAVAASIAAIVFWIRYKGSDPGHRKTFVVGMAVWILFGIHDALVCMGMPSVQYLMEYGYFFFSAVVLWFIFSRFVDISAEDKYRIITEMVKDGIIVMQGGVVVFGNPAASIIIGMPLEQRRLEEVVGMIHPEDGSVLMAEYENLLQTGRPARPRLVRIVREGGREGVIDIRSTLIQYRDKSAVLTVLRDVTGRIRDEEARRASEEKIFRLKKMESLGLLAGGVAHDLNNVLSGIINYPELILYDLPESSPLRRPIETIKASGLKAAAIVQDLLTMTRGVALVKETLNLNSIVSGYLESPEHRKLMRHHPGVSITVDLASGLLNAKGSSVHMGKVVMNLVANAVESIDGEGTVSISTDNRYLDRPLQGYDDVVDGEYTLLKVSDSGPGISPEDLKRIFDPFFTKKVMGRSGTGLGLTIVWNVLRDHDGYINVTSGARGTTFELYFPTTREKATVDTAPLSLEMLHGDGELVLVVDDMESQRAISCRMLERLNYRTHAVSCGEAAVEYLKDHSVDLLLLDMIMDPGINGCETYKRIITRHPGQRAVIVSGHTETDQVREAQEMGAGPYLKKPLLLEDLGRVVKKTLNRPVDGLQKKSRQGGRTCRKILKEQQLPGRSSSSYPSTEGALGG